MRDTQYKKIVYRYDVSVTVSIGVFITAIVPFLLYFLAVFIKNGDVLGIVGFSFALLLPAMAVGGLLSRAAIIITDDSVSAAIFGMTIRTLGWQQVRKINKFKTRLGNGKFKVYYFIKDQDHGFICKFLVNLCGDISFGDDIPGLDSLLEQINFYVRRYNIPLTSSDLVTAPPGWKPPPETQIDRL